MFYFKINETKNIDALTSRLSNKTHWAHSVRVIFLKTFCTQQVPNCNQRQIQVFNLSSKFLL